jgi:hypothetical protein
MGFKPKISVFERAKIVLALHLNATVIGTNSTTNVRIKKRDNLKTKFYVTNISNLGTLFVSTLVEVRC